MGMASVFVVGDSISIQYGPFLERFLRGVFSYARKEGEREALLNLDRPQGANGGDSSMVLEYLRALVATGTFRPDLLLVNCSLLEATAAGRESALIRIGQRPQLSFVWILRTLIMDRIERYRGCLLGLAVGDALGALLTARGLLGGAPACR